MQLNPSKLGTKSHWDQVYEQERQNFEETGDEGEIWFGQEAVDKMVDWALQNLAPGSLPQIRILDVGTGNGILPVALVEAGYDASSVYGIDYSQASIELAEQVAQGREVEGLTFRVIDFIGEDSRSINTTCFGDAEMADVGNGAAPEWNILMDKGTFDAMALSEAKSGEHATNTYPCRVEELLKPGGFFLITSCNFTEDEIRAHFTRRAPSLQYHSRVPHQSFSFGGKSGNTYATVAFQKSEEGHPVNESSDIHPDQTRM